MPALARPCTSGVETNKHMQVTCWHCGCWDHYECVDNQYLSPYRTGGKWLPWFLRKSRPFIFKYRPLGPTYFNIWGKFTTCGCVNDQYLSPYQTRAKWLPWLLRKSRPFIFIYRPLGPIYFNIWGIFTIVGVWMIITYHHTKPEPIGCLGCWEKAGPLYLNIGPWGPHTSNYGAYLPLWMCGWSLPITIPNQSHVAALVAKKKQALCI